MASNDMDKVQQFDHVESTDSVDKFVFSDEAAERGSAIQEEERNLTIKQAARKCWKSVMYSKSLRVLKEKPSFELTAP